MLKPASMPNELGVGGRVVTAAAATTDVFLRTMLATVVTATVAPAVTGKKMRSDTELLPFYAKLAAAGDASVTFVAPEGAPEVTATRQLPMAAGRRRGRVDLLRWPSRYTPLHPDLRDDYSLDGANGTCWAQHWRHRDGPRPTLLVCHGFGASPYLFNSAFFALPWLYSHGYDVVLLTLPHHGRRSGLGYWQPHPPRQPGRLPATHRAIPEQDRIRRSDLIDGQAAGGRKSSTTPTQPTSSATLAS